MSEMPEPVIVNDTQYYISTELEKKLPNLYVNAQKTRNRNIIKKLDIPDTKYIFANKTKTNGLWNVLTADAKMAKLLISKDWIDTFIQNTQNTQTQTKMIKVRKVVNTTSVVDTKVDTNVNNDIDIADKAVIIEPVPPVLHLDDNEKFHDTDGNVLEIMTCGERHEDSIYFDMTDVSKAFEMPNLRHSLMHKNGAYTRGQDYKVFNTSKRRTTKHELTGVTTNKRTFLSYSGLLRVVNVTRVVSINQECIQCWLNNLNLSFRKNTEHTLPNGQKKNGNNLPCNRFRS
jgi:hypothetical protein